MHTAGAIAATIFAQTPSDFERIVTNYGLPTALLLVVLYGAYRLCWFLAKRHVASLDRRDSAFESQAASLASVSQSLPKVCKADCQNYKPVLHGNTLPTMLAFVVLMSLSSVACGQWLPEDRQASERKLWDATGVEFPAGMKFYELPKVSQRLVGIVNYNPVDRFGIFSDKYKGSENVNAQPPWVTPSGLHWSPKSQWRKAAAAYFPGEVTVYRKVVGVLNSFGSKQPQPHIEWEFPDGTQFAEMLVRTAAGPEYVFEVRRYEIRGGKMIGGETFRPFAEPPAGAVKRQWEVPPGKLTDFGLKHSDVATYTLKMPAAPHKLVASRVTFTADDDNSFTPRGFLGTQRTCTDCHNQAGKPTSYGATTIRGSAPVISWHPFIVENVNTDAMPQLDSRWGLRTNYAGR